MQGRFAIIEAWRSCRGKKWATVLGGRYMGADRADEYGARNGVPGEYLVRVTPAKVVARRGIAD